MGDFFTTLKDLNNSYGNLISAVAGVFVAVVGGIIAYMLRHLSGRPKLSIYFPKNELKEPYFRKLGLDRYKKPIEDGYILYKPVLAILAKIQNKGKTTAKNVKVRIEKIVLENGAGGVKEVFYHPSYIKWSGESGWDPIDIVSKSYHFLDLIRFVNETQNEVVELNHALHDGYYTKRTLEQAAKDNNIRIDDNRIFWELWIENPSKRGIPKEYVRNHFKLHFMLDAENHKAFRFMATISWNQELWDKPAITIEVLRKNWWQIWRKKHSEP